MREARRNLQGRGQRCCHDGSKGLIEGAVQSGSDLPKPRVQAGVHATVRWAMQALHRAVTTVGRESLPLNGTELAKEAITGYDRPQVSAWSWPKQKETHETSRDTDPVRPVRSYFNGSEWQHLERATIFGLTAE